MRMTTPPPISVVIPVYNQANVIHRAITSVLDQDLAVAEILIVDDGSTDGLANSLERFDDPRLRLISHGKNQGAGAARNTGVEQAAGRYIAFLDSDDEWMPGKLREQMNVLENASSDVLACTTGFDLCRADRKTDRRLPKCRTSWRNCILDGCVVSPGSTLVVAKTAFTSCGGFDPVFKRLEDWDWLLRYTRTYELVTIPRCLARIHVNDSILTADVSSALDQIEEKHGDAIRSMGAMSWRRFRSALLTERALVAFRNNTQMRGTLLSLHALALNPARSGRFLGAMARKFLR